MSPRRREANMREMPDYHGLAKIFWSGRNQAVLLTTPCRFQNTEVEVISEGDQLTQQPRGNSLAANVNTKPRRLQPFCNQLALDRRTGLD